MKQQLILILMLSIQGFLFAQHADNTETNDSTNIYYHSMIKYCENLEMRGITKDILFIEENFLVTKSLPDRIGDYRLRCLDLDQLRRQVKKDQKIQLIRIVPLRVKGGEFFINVIPFTVTYQKKNFNFINSGGKKILYNFDTDTNKFLFKKIEHGSI